MELINYKFVRSETLPICTDQGTRELTVLVLDKEANDSYWKITHCFANFLIEQKLSGPDQAKQWIISSKFAALEAFQDLEHDIRSAPWTSSGPEDNFSILRIYGIPVKVVENEDLFCVLQLADDTLLENNLWQ